MEIRRDLPGAELVEAGLADLRAGRDSASALLVASFSRRLRRLGLDVPDSRIADPEVRLYRLLEQTEPNPYHFEAIEPRLFRFPNIDPPALRRAVEAAVAVRSAGEGDVG